MALKYYLYNTLYDNTLVDRSNNSFAPLPPNTGEIYIDYFIPEIQPLYYYKESGSTIVLNNENIINSYLINITSQAKPLDNVRQYTFTGYSATTDIAISANTAHRNIVTGNPHNVTKEDVGLGDVSNIFNKYDADCPPDEDNDEIEGYSVGSIWVDIVHSVNYICFDNTIGNAVWEDGDIWVKENNISSIIKGQVVYIVGGSGNRALINIADNTNPLKFRGIGVASTNINKNGNGFIKISGVLRNVDTRPDIGGINDEAGVSWNAGDFLYTNSNGKLTSTRPTSGRIIRAGINLVGSENDGCIYIKVNENIIRPFCASGESIIMRMGDISGITKTYFKDYDNVEVAAIDSDGNFTLDGTINNVNIQQVVTNTTNLNTHTGDTTIHYLMNEITGFTKTSDFIGSGNTTVSISGDSVFIFTTGNTLQQVTDNGCRTTNSMVIGNSGSCATGTTAFVQGYDVCAYGDYSHVEGSDTVSYGIASHAEGYYNISCCDYSHAEGIYNCSIGDYSHVEGSDTVSYGIASHAEGYYTFSCCDYSHTEGVDTCAINDYSHAEGSATKTYGLVSHSEGCYTCAMGSSSHSEGYRTCSLGNHSHSEGCYTIAKANNQHASGQYNCGCTTTIAEIGVGSGTTARCNAFEVYCNGQIGMPQLPTGSTGTCAIYIDNSGKLTSGYISNSTNGLLQLVDSVGGQSLDNITATSLTWGQQDFYDNTIFTHTLSGSSITVKKTGLYELSFNINGGVGVVDRSIPGIQFRKNSIVITSTLTASYGRNNPNNDTHNVLTPYLISLTCNDVLDVVAFRLGDQETNTTKAGASFVRITYLG